MLTKVEVYAPAPSTPVLTMGVADILGDDPVQVRNITGLGPVKANVNTTPFGLIDGEVFTGVSRGKRNIVLTVGLNPNWVDQTVASLRKMLYAYFMPKAKTRIRLFSTEYPTSEIAGYVESFEENMFSKDPELQISIICPKPDFVAITPHIITGVVDVGPTPTEFEYIGSVPTGFLLEIESSTMRPTFTGDVVIKDTVDNETQYFTVEGITIDAAAYFQMSTISGSKFVRKVIVEGGSINNILRLVTFESVWAEIKPGVNEFSVAVEDNPGQDWTLTYYDRFGGF